MLTPNNLHQYQKDNILRIIESPFIGLFLDMGLGKTVTTLSAIAHLLCLEKSKVLIIAPLKVAQTTWSDEIESWSQLKGLTVSKILGSQPKRVKALEAEADIYIINRENIEWLVEHFGAPKNFPFDFLVIDELSSFKSSKSKRFKALKKIRPFVDRVVGLTGTPSPNGHINLWSQVFLLDQGERLGRFKTKFEKEYFKVDVNDKSDFPKSIIASPEHEEKLLNAISDICISMKASDYLQLPKTVVIDRKVQLSEAQKELYNKLKAEKVLEITDGGEIVALNGAALSIKLLQLSNGLVYDSDKAVHFFHNEKLTALAEIIEELQDEPLLIFYNFKSDRDRILATFKDAVALETEAEHRAWNEGKIKILIAHPASAGHGLNLQKGGNHILWFGAIIDLELYMQANARLDRQGQTKPVKIIRLIASAIEQKWFKALHEKDLSQERVMKMLKAEIKML